MTIVDRDGARVDTSAFDTEHKRQLLLDALGGDEKDYAIVLMMLARKTQREISVAVELSVGAVNKRICRINSILIELGHPID